MSKIMAIIIILCMVAGMGLIYSAAYTICGEELIFTAEGEFERVTIKSPGSIMDLGYIHEDGGSFSYLTGKAPRNKVFQIVIYTSDSNYFDIVHTVIIGSKTFEIGDVQITVESRFEAVGTINSVEAIIIVMLGLLLGVVILLVVIEIFKGIGIQL